MDLPAIFSKASISISFASPWMSAFEISNTSDRSVSPLFKNSTHENSSAETDLRFLENSVTTYFQYLGSCLIFVLEGFDFVFIWLMWCISFEGCLKHMNMQVSKVFSLSYTPLRYSPSILHISRLLFIVSWYFIAWIFPSDINSGMSKTDAW